MSDQNAQEPTMEEILASIRRIISEDDAPAETPAAAATADDEPEAAFEPAPADEAGPPPAFAASPADEDDDVLELTDPIAAPQVETHGDLEIYSSDAESAPPPVAAAPAAAAKPQPAPAARLDTKLVGESAARASASAFNSLAQAIAMPHPGTTLEDVTRELLKPLLAQWLDDNLPRIVEAKVEEEVQRIARGR